MIETKNLCYTYDLQNTNTTKAIENVNILINSGETLGIIGKTGSGKSTLAKLFGKVLPSTSGEILFDKKSEKIGIVFQYPETQLFAKTVFDDIAFGPRNQRVKESNIKKIVEYAAKFTGLSANLLKCSPFEISGGEKRRCAIAGIIAMNPDVLILDEPTAGLDTSGKKELLRSLLDYHNKQKNTIIFISHRMDEIAMVADKVLVIDEGKQIFFDTPSNVFKNQIKLQQIGLDIPQTQKIISYINQKGHHLNENILTPEKAGEEILKFIKQAGD